MSTPVILAFTLLTPNSAILTKLACETASFIMPFLPFLILYSKELSFMTLMPAGKTKELTRALAGLKQCLENKAKTTKNLVSYLNAISKNSFSRLTIPYYFQKFLKKLMNKRLCG